MGTVFDFLYGVFHGTGPWAYLAVYAWGVMGMLLSPCSMATIPLVVGCVGNSECPSFFSSLRLSAAFSLGVFVNLAFLGGLITSAGVFLGGIDRFTNYIVAAAFVLFGLHLLGLLTIPWFRGSSAHASGYTGIRGALLLGCLSGLALGPCSFAYSAPVLLLAVKTASSDFVRALFLVASYGAGHSTVIIAAGSAADRLSRLLSRRGRGRGAALLNKASGILLLAAAAYLVSNAPSI